MNIHIMKRFKILTLVFILQLAISPVFAQKKPVVKEQMTSYGKTSANSLVIVIPEASMKSVEKEWKSLIKVYSGKAKGSKGMITAENVVISTMGTNSLSVLSKIAPVSDGVELSVAFNDNGNFITSSQDRSQFAAAENLLYNFGLRVARIGVGEKSSAVQKEFATLLKKQKDIEAKQKRLQSNIDKWEGNIKDAKRENEKNEKELEQLKKSIAEKKKEMDEMKDKQKQINKMN
jgi:vacuolar-type H+-ATPase subunit I/STV1